MKILSASIHLKDRVNRRKLAAKGASRLGFTLVELLLVIAIISIMAAMVISSFSDAAQSSREVIANQQLTVWQSALNNLVNGKLGRIDSAINGSDPITLEVLRNHYNNQTRKQRFMMLTGKDLDDATADTEGYLEPLTAEHYVATLKSLGSSTLEAVKSDAMVQTGQWLELPAWVQGSYPTVELYPKNGQTSRTPPAETSKE